MKDLQPWLTHRQAAGLYRRRRVVDGPQQPEMIVDGHKVISFCSNDYLGLANHPDVVKALKKGADHYGAGAGAAHLINGHSRAHHALEEALAEFTHRERALLFSTGYMANLGIVSALVGRGDAVFEDRLNHASLIDAGLLSGARLHRYRHADINQLESRIAKNECNERLIVTDGVFSMDGDIAPLKELTLIAKQHNAWLMVDDAHGLGVLGPTGRGSLEQLALEASDVPILMGTLGKGLGTFGAFVAGSQALIEMLIQSARTYIYTTALPAAVASATLVSLQIANNDSWRRERLTLLVEHFRKRAKQLGLPLLDSVSPIQPVMVGDSAQAVQLSGALFEQGFLVTAIRPPTVPEGSARLRFTFSAAHEETQIDKLLDALEIMADGFHYTHCG